MKQTFKASIVVSCLLAAVLILGCDEIRPAVEGPSIAPPSASVSKGQSITFTALDGFEYGWRLSNKDLGILSAVNGPTTTYTSLSSPATDSSVQTLTLTSRIIGSQGGSSNQPSYTTSAEAFIRHISVKVTPTTVASLTRGQSVSLRATDGTSYAWSLRFPQWGSLSSSGGQDTIYTSTYDPGESNTVEQVVIVRSFDDEATTTITHTH